MFKTVRRARLGAAAALLAAGGGVGLAAAPAAAAPAPPVTVALTSGTIAPGTSKFFDLVITNNGTDEIKGLRLIIDPSGLDQSKVSLYELLQACAPATGGKLDCPPDVTTLGAAQKAVWKGSLNSISRAALGAAGHLDVHVEWSGGSADKSFPLAVAGHGPDLNLETPDAPQMLDDNGKLYVGRLGPGEVGTLSTIVENFGDAPAGTLKLTVNLPAGAVWDEALIKAFPADYTGCTFDARTADCRFGDLVLTPESQFSGTWFWVMGFPIQLDATARSGVNLRGGAATVTGVPADATKLKRATTAGIPRGTLARVAVAAPSEVDRADNASSYAVLVKTFGTGGPGDGDSGTGGPGSSGGGGGGTGGGLPITGPVAASVAGAGVVALGVGTFLVLAARRRRISFAAPGDARR